MDIKPVIEEIKKLQADGHKDIYIRASSDTGMYIANKLILEGYQHSDIHIKIAFLDDMPNHKVIVANQDQHNEYIKSIGCMEGTFVHDVYIDHKRVFKVLSKSPPDGSRKSGVAENREVLCSGADYIVVEDEKSRLYGHVMATAKYVKEWSDEDEKAFRLKIFGPK